MEEKRFRKGQSRYMTGGINERLPLGIQMILWSMVEALRNVEKPDYLQVFELETIGDRKEGTLVQVITHSQEQPKYSRVCYIPIMGEGATGKVYIIDDGEYATMLWADEY